MNKTNLTLILLGVLCLGIATNPSPQAHKDELKQKVLKIMREEYRKEMDINNVSGIDIFNKKMLRRNDLNLDYKYLILIDIKDLETENRLLFDSNFFTDYLSLRSSKIFQDQTTSSDSVSLLKIFNRNISDSVNNIDIITNMSI